MNILVVGSGQWAHFLNQRLGEIPGSLVKNVRGREIYDNSSSNSQSIQNQDLVVCATRPETQEMIIETLTKNTRRIWLEKPLGKSLEGCAKIISTLTQSQTYGLVNLPWNYSNIWQEFKKLDIPFCEVDLLEITREGVVGARDYMSIIEDYGTHDLALILDWLKSESQNPVGITRELLSETEFKMLICNTRVSWNWKRTVSSKGMIWNVTLRNKDRIQIDFYKKCIARNGVLIELGTPKGDNIDAFLEVLFSDSKKAMNDNLNIALNAKEIITTVTS